MDNEEIVIPGQDGSSFAIMMIPPGVEKSRDFPFAVNESADLAYSIQSMLDAIQAEETVVLQVDGKHVDIFIRIGRAMDVELRALQGFEGDYPSYWLAGTNMLPQAVASEMALASENSSAVGGSGVQPKKMEKTEFKSPDYDDVERRRDAFKGGADTDAEVV